ncbi:unnamed protein product, partial [Oikopleura dioica]
TLTLVRQHRHLRSLPPENP